MRNISIFNENNEAFTRVHTQQCYDIKIFKSGKSNDCLICIFKSIDSVNYIQFQSFSKESGIYKLREINDGTDYNSDMSVEKRKAWHHLTSWRVYIQSELEREKKIS